MIVGDLIYNDDFDVNCNYAIYKGQWSDRNCLWSTRDNGYSKPPCKLLDERIRYITIDTVHNELVIEM